MSRWEFVLVDRARAEQFAVLGRAGGLFSRLALRKDDAGVAWALARVEDFTFAVTWLGPGRVFDPHAVRQEDDALRQRRQLVREASDDQHRHHLNAVVQ